MELKDFIKNSLLSIDGAVKEASDEAKKDGEDVSGTDRFLIAEFGEMPDAKYINFDIAVTVSSEISGELKGKGNIFVAELNAGGQAKRGSENVSRINFKVHCT